MKKKIVSVFMVAVMVLSMSFVCASTCDAASKKSSKKKGSDWYHGLCHEKSWTKKNKKSHYGTVYKVQFEGNKMIVYGSLVKAKKKDLDAFQKGKYLKSTKRTFTLANNVKCVALGGTEPEVIDKEFIESYVNKHCMLSFYIHKKNGKVVELQMAS